MWGCTPHHSGITIVGEMASLEMRGTRLDFFARKEKIPLLSPPSSSPIKPPQQNHTVSRIYSIRSSSSSSSSSSSTQPNVLSTSTLNWLFDSCTYPHHTEFYLHLPLPQPPS
ncbi:hypothetical protein BcDW1_9157 [Botrytis cinerea BcDW1]|uniref:Uncharacterized protein n=1 Tax=Botryotinia fuckeliana (strain BcDW1) TaxID=1290391 RepID=M7TMD3_BOTF1|nr:hypothetical protein BcDW1_9157 [Botrytis cinerea BcDW1]